MIGSLSLERIELSHQLSVELRFVSDFTSVMFSASERLHQVTPKSVKARWFLPLKTTRSRQTNLPPKGTAFLGRRLDKVKPVLDDLRERVAASQFVIRSADRPPKKPKRIVKSRKKRQKLSITVSLGAAERCARETPAEMVGAADAALYRAKEAGRNRVVA